MLDNAEFIRSVRGDKDLPRGTVHVTGYVMLATLWFLYHFARYQAGEELDRLVGPYLLGLLGFHFFVAAFAGLLAGGASIARDKENGTLDSQRITALTPLELAAGKLLGLTASTHFVNLLALPFALGAATLGGFSVGQILAVFAILTGTTFFYCALGLLMSTGAAKGDSGSGNAMVGGLLLTGVLASCPVPVIEAATPVPALFHLMGTVRPAERYAPPLAGLGIPIELLTVLFYALGTWACLLGVTRYLARPAAPPWTRKQLLTGYAGMVTLAVGFLLSYPVDGAVSQKDLLLGVALFQSLMMVALVAIGVALVPGRERTEQELWRGAVSGREQLLGESGSPLAFLVLLAALSNAVPLAVWAAPWLNAGASAAELGLLLVVGNALTFLALKFACRTHEWMTLVVPDFARFLTFFAMMTIAMGPLAVAMATTENVEHFLPLLMVGNPPFVLINLVNPVRPSADPSGLAMLSILLASVLALSSCYLATRRRATLAAQIAAKKASLGVD